MFSVIIPTYNNEETLKRAVDSVLNRDIKSLKLLL